MAGKAKGRSGDKTPGKTPGKRPGSENLAPAWKPGQSGNPAGRPKGIRNAILADTLLKLQLVVQSHGDKAIVEMAEKTPSRFVECVLNMMPREVGFDEEATEGFAILAAALAKRSKGE